MGMVGLLKKSNSQVQARNMKKTGSDFFIVDNSDEEWKVLNYLSEWSGISSRFDIATGYFEIGALLALDGTRRTYPLRFALYLGFARVGSKLEKTAWSLMRSLVRAGLVEVEGCGTAARYRKSKEQK